MCLYTLDTGTGVATLVGTTGLFQTPFLGLTWCGGLTTIARRTSDERPVGHREHLHR